MVYAISLGNDNMAADTVKLPLGECNKNKPFSCEEPFLTHTHSLAHSHTGRQNILIDLKLEVYEEKERISVSDKEIIFIMS